MAKKYIKKYRITLSERQLHLIIGCVEDIHRFMGGQVELSNCTALLDNTCDVREMLKDVYPLVVPELFRQYGLNASYGWNGGRCPNKHQKKFLAETYYIYRELQHQLTIRDKRQDYNVYHGETLICEDSGEPIIVEEYYGKINTLAQEAYNNALKRGKINPDDDHETRWSGIWQELDEFHHATNHPSEHLPQYTQRQEELADVLICCLTELHREGVDIQKIIEEKITYNNKR